MDADPTPSGRVGVCSACGTMEELVCYQNVRLCAFCIVVIFRFARDSGMSLVRPRA